MSIRFSDIIEKFDGTGDFSQWIDKLELVAKLQKIKDLESFVPLFLCGSAFDCYKAINEEDRSDYKKVKLILLEKYCSDPALAYEELIRRKLIADENVESYYADISRLAHLVDPAVSDNFLKSAFMAGLPLDTKEKLRASNDVIKLDFQELIKRTRVIVRSAEVCAASIVSDSSAEVACVAKKLNNFSCYSCGQSGHISKYCTTKFRNNIKCSICNLSGHIARQCSQRYCYVCGDKTHLSHACPDRKMQKNE